MSAIKGFIFKYKRLIIFLLLSFISLNCILISHRTALTHLRKFGFSVFVPLQIGFHSIGSFFENTFYSISELKQYKAELEKTQNELNLYKQLIIDYNDLNNEIRELKKNLELKKSISYETLSCEIIGRDPKTLFASLIVNKGSADGVLANMPVISYSAGKRVLVGKVVETTFFASKIITVQNPLFSAGASILSTNAHVMVQGINRQPGIIKLLYLPKNFALEEGKNEYLATSGDSYIFPKGIEIGKIERIYPSANYEIFNEADVRISLDLSKMDYVLILKLEYKKENLNTLDIGQ